MKTLTERKLHGSKMGQSLRDAARDKLDEPEIPSELTPWETVVDMCGKHFLKHEVATFLDIEIPELEQMIVQHGFRNWTTLLTRYGSTFDIIVKNLFYERIMDNCDFKATQLYLKQHTVYNDTVPVNTGNKPQVTIIDDDDNYIRINLEHENRLLIFKRENFLKHQWTFLKSRTSELGLVAGYGAGKTHAFIRKTFLHMLQSKLTGKNVSLGAVIYPTLVKARNLFAAPFVELCRDNHIIVDYNKTEGVIRTIYGTVYLWSMDRPEKIIGDSLTYIGLDELDTLTPRRKAGEVWGKAIGRLRGMSDAQIYSVTTPEGFHFTYNKFVKEPQTKIAEGREVTTELIKAKTTDNPYLPDSFIEALRGNYDSKMLEQYLNGEFVNLNGNVAYYSFDRELHCKKIETQDTSKIYVGMDFNVNPMSAIVFTADVNKAKGTIRSLNVIESISLKNSNTRQMAQAIKKKYPKSKIITIVDRAGNARKTSAEKTDVEILRGFGFVVKFESISERDKINRLNLVLESGVIHIDDERCDELVTDLEHVILDEKGKIDKRDLSLTHMTDALGYAVWHLTKRPAVIRTY